MVDTPIQIFHVSAGEVAEEIARARRRGLKVFGETCPQYLTLSDEDLDRPGFEGAKFVFSPAARPKREQAALWRHIQDGTLDIVSSDHAPWNYDDAGGKKAHGEDAPFNAIPNGVPGLAARLPLLFEEGVQAGRITLNQFVAITATNPARLFGLYPRKGTIAIGAEADLVLWDPTRSVRLDNAAMQHAVDYTAFEGRTVRGWPRIVLLRGKVAMQDDKVLAEPGDGAFLPRGRYDYIRPSGHLPTPFDPVAGTIVTQREA
jgi:dihydropyrimidinase